MSKHSRYPAPARLTTGEAYTPRPGSYGPWSMRCGQCSQTLSQSAAKKHRMWGHICADREACAARRAR